MVKKQKIGTILRVAPKTARVRVDRMLRHPVYLKQYRSSASFLVDVPEGMSLEVGDRVLIEETRPVSARKAWRVLEVVARPDVSATLTGTEEAQ